LNHPNPGAKLLELNSPKGLGEKVGELILGVDVSGLDAPLIQAAPDEVVLDADMLAVLMEDGFFAKAKADLLSTLSSTASASLPRRSPSSRANQRA
jgi:hypothetical protein